MTSTYDHQLQGCDRQDGSRMHKKMNDSVGSTTRKYTSPASDKALDVLELLSKTEAGLTQQELAKALGRNVTEVFRVLVTLEERGYLLREDGKYILSDKFFELAYRHPPVERLLLEALPIMRSLADQTGQSCHLAVRNNMNALIIGQVSSPLPIGIGARLGALIPVLETTSGLVLLAFEDDSSRERWLGQLSPSNMSFAAQRGIPGRLDEVRKAGFVREASTTIDGVTNIGAPVFDLTGQVQASLTMLFLTQKAMYVPIDTAQEMLLAAARNISNALGMKVF
ncbi:IclR family transcriptional regulator [Phyllobacterium sp. 21LDTY02-6]|uniref:IclR family transcriptional regulator n=1 Tax=Phyllobacterium sp. 21LDTY02-6 TaxID=2944903 RepID=UPI002020270F|nr:IclR family transcriptional regulator [Phyllobacterium sp. 21LDTY02-6]MCO4319159.1 IclR family transcriptional regulator [Phyllobacterium sp. 21LDTY02-6]